MSTRRGFLGALLSLAAAPALAGFAPTVVAQAVAPERYLNVRDFGAVGDGATDDGPAIRKAVARALPGQTIVFPAGTYLMGSAAVGRRTTILRWMP